jgi:hypothetical protein
MAEFCLDCYNKLHKTNLKKKDVALSKDLCEGCGKVTKTIDYIYTTKKSPVN